MDMAAVAGDETVEAAEASSEDRNFVSDMGDERGLDWEVRR